MEPKLYLQPVRLEIPGTTGSKIGFLVIVVGQPGQLHGREGRCFILLERRCKRPNMSVVFVDSDRVREKWQRRVDTAELLLMLADGQADQLCSGLSIDREECYRRLAAGQERNIVPTRDEARLAALEFPRFATAILDRLKELDRRLAKLFSVR